MYSGKIPEINFLVKKSGQLDKKYPVSGKYLRETSTGKSSRK
jgi:hypothetical protein